MSRRDNAILRLFADTGIRLSELVGLDLADVDVREKVAFVTGKGPRALGPRHRAVPFGSVTARALVRFQRARARRPWAEDAALWLASRGNRRLSLEGVKRMVARRGEAAGITRPTSAQVPRHAWAHYLRAAGGSEGDLMILGGWRSRQQIDRYGASAAGERARDAYRALSLGDRLSGVKALLRLVSNTIALPTRGFSADRFASTALFAYDLPRHTSSAATPLHIDTAHISTTC